MSRATIVRKWQAWFCVILGLGICIAGFATSNPGALFGTLLPDLSSYSCAVISWPSNPFISTQLSVTATVGSGPAASLTRSYGLQNEGSPVYVPAMTLTTNGQTQQWTYSSSLHGIQYSASVPTGLSNSYFISYGVQMCNITLTASTAGGQFLSLPLCPLIFDRSASRAYKLASVCVAASATGGGAGLYVNPAKRGCMWPMSGAASVAPALPPSEGAVIQTDSGSGLVIAQYVRQALYSRADLSSLQVTIKGAGDPYILATGLTQGTMDLNPSPGLGARIAFFVAGLVGTVLMIACCMCLLLCIGCKQQRGAGMAINWPGRRGGAARNASGAATEYVALATSASMPPVRQQRVDAAALNVVPAAVVQYPFAGMPYAALPYAAPADAGRPPVAPGNALAPLANAYAASFASGVQRAPPSVPSFDGFGSDPKMLESAQARAALNNDPRAQAASAAAAAVAPAGGAGYSGRSSRFAAGRAAPAPAPMPIVDDVPRDVDDEDNDEDPNMPAPSAPPGQR